jgi:RNA-directed DNA polymerase
MKVALQKVELNKLKNKYVLKSDVRKYYASIDHEILLSPIRKIIPESRFVGLIYQFLKHVRYRDGYYVEVEKGISRGTSLSPLLGALYLSTFDRAMEKMNVTYVRFVDDWVVMSDNRRTFSRAIKKVYRILSSLKLEKSKDKTFIGKIDRGFDFLGFYFGKEGRTIAKKTVLKFAERIAVRLYKAGYDRNEFKGG